MLEIRNLRKYFPIKGGIFQRKAINFVKAVDNVSFSVKKGETLALVGESGCGKTTLGRTILRLIEPTSGSIFFNTPSEILREIDALTEKVRRNSATKDEVERLNKLNLTYNIALRDEKSLKTLRKEMQIVFQDPLSSLDPRMTIRETLSEPLKIHEHLRKEEIEDRVLELLKSVGLKEEHMHRYPHEFSGGQRQRICILRAISLKPKFMVLDEPTSALDVSVQAQILNLLKRLQREFNLTYLFITHDLSVVRFMSTRVAVMYLGKIVEMAPTEELFNNPLHPCTRSLLEAVPIPEPTTRRKKLIIEGDVPSPVNPPSGCRFHTRCPYATEACSKEEPPLIEVSPEHLVACPLADKLKKS